MKLIKAIKKGRNSVLLKKNATQLKDYSNCVAIAERELILFYNY